MPGMRRGWIEYCLIIWLRMRGKASSLIFRRWLLLSFLGGEQLA